MRNKMSASVVLTDLDNTLYDWVDIWYKSFKAMLDQLVEESGVSGETLVKDFKQIHEKHGTSEYALAIEELPSLKAKSAEADWATRFEVAIRATDPRARRRRAFTPELWKLWKLLKTSIR
jgi:FMN phosphatase YigB (HAD superfamily)